MTYRGKPILYVRVPRGGREAARAQERQIREALNAAGVPTSGMHVYCDIDVPVHQVGNALGLLLDEATYRRVGTVIVQSLARFGCYEVIMHALMTLDRGGADVLVASDVAHDDRIAERLRSHAPSPSLPRVMIAATDAGEPVEVRAGDDAA